MIVAVATLILCGLAVVGCLLGDKTEFGAKLAELVKGRPYVPANPGESL